MRAISTKIRTPLPSLSAAHRFSQDVPVLTYF
jgi:hypothetical protein